jgi:hypothetical protein
MMIEDLSRRVAMAGVSSYTPAAAQSILNGSRQDVTEEGGGPTLGTFEKASFSQILAQYNQKHDLPPTVELT